MRELKFDEAVATSFNSFVRKISINKSQNLQRMLELFLKLLIQSSK